MTDINSKSTINKLLDDLETLAALGEWASAPASRSG